MLCLKTLVKLSMRMKGLPRLTLIWAVGLLVVATAATTGSSSASMSFQVNVTDTKQKLEGWGTSLCWWANGIGKWNNQTKVNEILDLIFDPVKGLGLNQARYNIGGGENPEHLSFLRPGAYVEGYQLANGTFDWTADVSQRKILLGAISRGVKYVEAFSNSPPYWMTVSGSVTGSKDGGNNLRDDMYVPFANYLATVVQHFKEDSAYGPVTFNSVTPLNEPVSNWWRYGKAQEGCHFDRDKQSMIVDLLGSALMNMSSSEVTVAGPEENSIDDTLKSLESYSPSALSKLGMITTHTYNGQNREGLAQFAATHGKTLWNSEYGDGSQPLQGGITLAQRITEDLNQMNETVWTLWQALDLDNSLSPASGWGPLAATYHVPGGVFNIQLEDSNSCVTANGSAISLQPCDGSVAQNWFVGDDDTIRSGSSEGPCLDDWGQGMQEGDLVRLYSCWGGSNQKWVVTDTQIRLNNQSGLCLDDWSNTTELRVYKCWGGSNQKFNLVRELETVNRDRSQRVETPYTTETLKYQTDVQEEYIVRPQFYAYKQFTRFIRPSSTILTTKGPSLSGNLAVLASKDENGTAVTMVITNAGRLNASVEIAITGTTSSLGGSAQVFLTDASTSCEQQQNVTVSNGQVTLNLPGESITTVIVLLI